MSLPTLCGAIQSRHLVQFYYTGAVTVQCTTMSTLRDFWFPILLALFGLAGGFLADQSEGNGRRFWLSVMGVLLLVSWFSYIWGDPVRGPFAYLTRRHDAAKVANTDNLHPPALGSDIHRLIQQKRASWPGGRETCA